MKTRDIVSWIGITIVAIAVISAKSDNTQTGTSATTSQNYITLATGESGEINNLLVTVLSYGAGTTLNKYSSSPGSYNLLSITIKNTAQSSKYIYTSKFKLVDSVGNEYDCFNDEWISQGDYQSYVRNGYSDVFDNSLQPSTTYNIDLIFPPAQGSNVTLRVYK